MFLDSNPNEKLGACALLIEKVLRNKAIAPFILIQGENKMFEKMAKMMKREVFKFKGIEESRAQIHQFLS